MHLSWERSSVRHLLSSDGAGWLSVVGSVSRTVSVHRAHAVRCRTPVLLVVLTGGSVASAGSSLCADFVIGGSNGHLQLVICGEYISLKSRMRAPNSDLKGHVLDDLALGRGGRLFNTWGGNWDTPACVKIVLIRSIAFHACGAQAGGRARMG